MFKKSEKDILKGIKPIEKIEEIAPVAPEKTAEQKIEEEIVDVSTEES